MSTAAAVGTTFDVGVTTLTDVSAVSRIAYDVRDMAEALERHDFLAARRIYQDGKYSPQYDAYGNEMDRLLSLQRMSGSAGEKGIFDEDPTYAFQILGLANAGQSVETAMATQGEYANNYITELLNDYDSGTLGAQASTILVVSMYATHQLWDGLLDCIAVKNGFNPDADKTGKINPRQSFDNFIALYVGAGQTLAPAWEGDMLYELAQAGADLFDTVDHEGEAIVNSDIRQLYQSIQRTVSPADYCRADDQVEWLWLLVNRIVARMYVPMVQMLIHSMKQEDQAHKVRMYALAVVPQLAQCIPSVHRRLKDYLLDNEYDPTKFDRILSLLQQSYDCLGFQCDDVGAYKGDVVAECAGYDKDHPLASFVPKKDVRSLSKADLDILAIDQLLKFPSTTNNQMAQLYYRYGKAAEVDDNDFGYQMMSLQAMADSSEQGKWSPFYNDYVKYFKMDQYHDSAIMAAFDDKNDVLRLHPDQRVAYLTTMMRYGVVPQYMMSLLGLALQICADPDNDKSPVLYWDAFAALYIGSLEGIGDGGSEDDGLMVWGIANNRARQFNTQDDNFRAVINGKMTDLLFAGQSQLERGDCVNFEKTASQTLHLMLLPLIQSTIWYAIRNERLRVGSTDEDLAIGEAMAYSVLPIVSKFDQKAAAVIERNMIRTEGVKPVTEGAQAVANALFKILDDIGWGCTYVGQADGIDACELFDPQNIRSSGSMISRLDTASLFIGMASAMWGVFSS